MPHCYPLISQYILERLSRAVPGFPITRTRKRVRERLYLQLKPDLEHVERSYAEPAQPSITSRIQSPDNL